MYKPFQDKPAKPEGSRFISHIGGSIQSDAELPSLTEPVEQENATTVPPSLPENTFTVALESETAEETPVVVEETEPEVEAEPEQETEAEAELKTSTKPTKGKKG